MKVVYRTLYINKTPLIQTTIETAEMIVNTTPKINLVDLNNGFIGAICVFNIIITLQSNNYNIKKQKNLP